MQFKCTFKPIRENSFIVEAESLAQATMRANQMRMEQVTPKGVQIEELTEQKGE